MKSIRILALLSLIVQSLAADSFTDVTVAAGLSYQQHSIVGEDEITQNWFTGGAAVADYDGDGWPDLFVTRLDATDILFRNNQDGSFTDVTTAAFGSPLNLFSNGACWGDIDNDGDADLCVLTIRSNRYYLYINDGAGHFTEEAMERGAAVWGGDEHFGQSPTVGDFNNDGFLDLHMTQWRFDSQNPTGAKQNTRLLLNRGAAAPGHFVDVTEVAGVAFDDVLSNRPEDFDDQSFSNRFADMDGDGFLDLLITSDHHTSRLFWNNGDGTFTDGTVAANVGTDSFGMGSSIADYDGDGDLDWFVTSIYDETLILELPRDGNRLFRNDGNRSFTDVTDEAGVRDGAWGWGASFVDVDNDGDLDLAQTNGMDFPVPLYRDHAHGSFVKDSSRLWINDGNGVFSEEAALRGMTDTLSGKGLLTFDYDRDGDMDLFITNNGEQPILYRNDCSNGNNWLQIEAEGTTSNRDGLGAFITVTPDLSEPDEIVVHEVHGGNNMLSQNEKIAHFGLGSHTDVDQVSVRWPSGVTQNLSNVSVNQRLALVEPPAFPTDGSEPDSLDDSWELLHFGNLSAKAAEDADGDQRSNAEELAAGTNPLDASDFFNIQATDFDSLTDEFSLTWQAKAGHRYRVERATLNQTNQWEAVSLQAMEVDALETKEIVSNLEKEFFRVIVERVQP